MEPLTTAEKAVRVALLIAIIMVMADVLWIKP